MNRSALPLLCLACIAGIIRPALAEAADSDPTVAMQAMHQRVKNTLDNPGPENPFYLQARSNKNTESGEAAAYLSLSLDDVTNALGTVSHWCNILPLHINVKTCTYSQAGDTMTLYMGRKFYQAPEDAYELTYTFKTITSDNYFAAIAQAEKGPFKTSNYQIKLEFISIDDKTFGRFLVSNQQSWLSRQGMLTYLATKGRNKQGIKVIEHDKQGNPVYSSGAEGVAERNLVRYFLAFLTFFDSATETDMEKRYTIQLNDWFDRSEAFPQLYEMSKQQYLHDKLKERTNQRAMQAANRQE